MDNITENNNLNKKTSLEKAKPFLIVLASIVLLAMIYIGFSYLKPDSRYSFKSIFNSEDDKYPVVRGTIKNARIMISFQDNIDESTAKDILANYAKDNKNMTFNVFQDRICAIWVNPITADIDSEINNLNTKANFKYIEKSIQFEGKYVGKAKINLTARSQDCNLLKSKIESLGYEITFFDITPVLATVETDVNKKKSLLKTFEKDKNFKDVQFEYPD